MSKSATLTISGKSYELPILTGSEGEKAIDIRTLRSQSKYMAFDSGLANTASCQSAITFINGEEAFLRHHGIPIETLAAQSSFLEVSYLLLHDTLPTKEELTTFSAACEMASKTVDSDCLAFVNQFPQRTQPMQMLISSTAILSAFCQAEINIHSDPEEINAAAVQFLGRFPVIIAGIYHHLTGQDILSIEAGDGSYSQRFLAMLFSQNAPELVMDTDVAKALDMLLIVHADHGQNCSTSAVRLVASSHADLCSALAAGIAALSGPLHGAANQAVLEMLSNIYRDNGDTQKFIEMAKDKKNPFRLSGFGHRVYKNYDPRARIIKDICMKVLKKRSPNDPLLAIALQLEEEVRQDDYFIERKLYPNVDFYSGLIYKAIGIPSNLFTALFTLGRLPGWISQWIEATRTPDGKIYRPCQLYTGKVQQSYIPIEERG